MPLFMLFPTREQNKLRLVSETAQRTNDNLVSLFIACQFNVRCHHTVAFLDVAKSCLCVRVFGISSLLMMMNLERISLLVHSSNREIIWSPITSFRTKGIFRELILLKTGKYRLHHLLCKFHESSERLEISLYAVSYSLIKR